MALRWRSPLLFISILLLSGDFAAGQQPPQVPQCSNKSKTAKTPISHPIVGHGLSFTYSSTPFQETVATICHERLVINNGPALYFEWRDNLGKVLAAENGLAEKPVGLIGTIANGETGEVVQVPSVIKYGPWQAGPYTEDTHVYRSTSEWKRAPVDSGHSTSTALSSIFFGVVLDADRKPHSFSVSLRSEITGSVAPFTIKYELQNGVGQQPFAVMRRMENLSTHVVLSEPVGALFKQALEVFPGDGRKAFVEKVTTPQIMLIAVEVFSAGNRIAEGRIEAFVPKP